jgi:hypothetical protein
MLQSAAMNALSSQCMIDLQSLSQIVSNEEEFEIKKILKRDLYDIKKIQEEVLDKMSQLYLIHMRINICSERHSDIKSMKVNAT